MKKMMLDKEESALEQELERGEWVAVPHLEEEMAACRAAAYQNMRKNRKINIRLSDWNYDHIKIQAAQEGLPYQTLVSSIIHKYLTGRRKAA